MTYKKRCLLFLAAVIITLPLDAAATNWTHRDTGRQVLMTGLILVDWMQTQEIVKDPGNHREMNPILGGHPSMSRVNILIGGAIVASYVVARLLPARWRPWFQWAIIGIEAAAVVNNHRRGISISF